ncbi:toxin glutamine deamidase domain-containing protein [Agromyces sp. CCNWLW203]|uniref:toxin glutamine deamidase domain-containing protein n=1 Tax=Agromyces sp. CCNWLW203 TaxID=3112842 RepID=UPI002F96A3D1
MTQVKLDPARLVQDGDDLYSIATMLDSAVTTLLSQLNGCSGMAGDDNAAEEFCEGSEGYDQLAGPTIDAVTSHGNALRILDAALSNTARAYDAAQKPGAGLDPETARPAEATARIDNSKANPSNALGPGWPGPLGEFQEILEWGLAQVGVVIPTGDEDKLQTAADAWGNFSSSITSARTSVASSFTNVNSATLPGPQKASMLACRTSMSTGLGELRQSADAMEQWIRDFRTQLRQMREELGWFLKQMAIEIAAELAIGGLLTVVTAGLGALATAAKVGHTVVRWCIKIAQLIQRLKTFLKGIRGVKGMVVRGGLRAAKEGLTAGLASTISVTYVNSARAGEEGYQQQNVGTAFVSAFAGGAIASPVSRVLGGSGGPGVKAGAREVGAETVAGAADGLVSSGVEAGMNNTEFNPISGMVLGALLGGGMTAAGRGLSALKPGSNAGTGSGVTTPDGIPTPGGSGDGSSNQGSGGSVDISNDAPQPGAGDAGTSAGDGGGSVDIPTDAPTGGGGDGGAGSGDGAGSVDMPGTSAGDGGTPADNGGTPADNGGTPADNGGTPADNGGTSADNGGTPVDNGGTSADNGATPVDNGGTPADNGGTPADNGTTPADNGGTPADNGGTPADNGGTPADNGTTPADNGGTPADNGGTPVDNGTTPADNSGTPADTGTTPADNGGTPVDNGGTPADNGGSVDIEAPAVDGAGSNGSEAPTAGAAGGASSTGPKGDGSNGDADGSSTDSNAADTDSNDTDSTDAPGDGDEGSSPESSDVDGLLAPDAAAGAGGAAVAGAAALMLGKPGFLPTHTPGGSTPAAPKPAGPNADGSSNPSNAGADGSGANDAGSNEASTPDSGADSDNGATSENDGAQQPDADEGGSNHSDRTLDEIDAALSEINPNYDPSDPANGYATNCGNTSANLNDFLNGDSSSEASTGTLDVSQMEARTGNPQTPMTPEQIDATLRDMGEGSHCVVGIDRSTGDGHWFNAYFDGDTVWSIDAQNGSRSPWPPAEPDATNWDASIQPERVTNPDGTKPNAVKPEAPAADGTNVDATNPDGTAPSPTLSSSSASTTTSPTHSAPNSPSTASTSSSPTSPSTAPTQSTSSTPAAVDGSTPTPVDGSISTVDGSTADGTDGSSTTDSTDGNDSSDVSDRSASRPKWTPPANRVDPSHASDGSDGAGVTFNGYNIPELTPEIRQQLNALADLPDSPIVRNTDGSFSLKKPITVTAFERSNSNHDWDEFQRQVGLQQQGLNALTIAEWRHNVAFYNKWNRVAKTLQQSALDAMTAKGIRRIFTTPAVLHGPDQIAGGRADRFDGAGHSPINSSHGPAWRGKRITGLRTDVASAVRKIDPKLHAHIKLTVHLGATDSVGGNPNATQGTLTAARPVTGSPSPASAGAGSGSTPGASAPGATPASGSNPSGSTTSGTTPSGSTTSGTTPTSGNGVTGQGAPARTGAAPTSMSGQHSGSGTNPAESGTNPAESGTNPAESGTNPAESGTNPAESGTNPAESANDAGTEGETSTDNANGSDTAGDAGDADPGSDVDATPETDAEPAPADGASADSVEPRVPETIHHQVLDDAFPHLTTPEPIAQAIHIVNGMGVTVDQGRFLNNCHYVVNALELRLRGYDVIASPTVQGAVVDGSTGAISPTFEGRFPHSIAADWVQTDGSSRDFEQLGDFQGQTAREALDALTASWPEGGRGFIAGYWKTGGGHIFTVVKEADGVKLYDGQVNQTDVSGYLDAMHFNETSSAPWKDILVMRVDDLVPTSEVLKTSKPWTQPEYQLLVDWRDAADPSALPQQMIDREIAANERWRDRNTELIAERLTILHDPATSIAEAHRLQGEIQVLRDQNLRLEAGAVQFKLELATPTSNAPAAPAAPATPSGEPTSGSGGASSRSTIVTNGPGDDYDEERDDANRVGAFQPKERD